MLNQKNYFRGNVIFKYKNQLIAAFANRYRILVVTYLVTTVTVTSKYAHGTLRVMSHGIQALETLLEHPSALVSSVRLLQLRIHVLQVPLEALAVQLRAQCQACLDTAGDINVVKTE